MLSHSLPEAKTHGLAILIPPREPTYCIRIRTYICVKYEYVLEIRLNVSVIERKTLFKLNYSQNGSGTCNRV